MPGRIRSLKPEILEDEKTASLSADAFRLFVASLLLADDHGNLRIAPKQLEGAVFWAQASRVPVADLVHSLADCGLWTMYTVRSQAYAHVTNWTKHQRVDHPGKPRVPGPSEGLATVSRDCRELLAPDLRSPTSDHDLRPKGSLPLPDPSPPLQGSLVGLAPDVAPRDRAKTERDAAGRVLARLNAVCGRDYPTTGVSLDMVLARFHDKRQRMSEADLIAVVEYQHREWAGDEKMAKFLRPATLFARKNCAMYLAAALQRRSEERATAAPTLCRKCRQAMNGASVEGCHRRCYYPENPELWEAAK